MLVMLCTAYTYTMRCKHQEVGMHCIHRISVRQDSVKVLACWELSMNFQANLPYSTVCVYAVITCTDMGELVHMKYDALH